MAILLNNIDSMQLWGLVAHHYTKPRYIPFLLCYACEFIMKSMGLQLCMELQLAEQKAVKRILLKCDGAALYYDGKVFLLGVTPTESQVVDIANSHTKNEIKWAGVNVILKMKRMVKECIHLIMRTSAQDDEDNGGIFIVNGLSDTVAVVTRLLPLLNCKWVKMSNRYIGSRILTGQNISLKHITLPPSTVFQL
ncbi:phytochrome E [Tanacetum coccineum]